MKKLNFINFPTKFISKYLEQTFSAPKIWILALSHPVRKLTLTQLQKPSIQQFDIPFWKSQNFSLNFKTFAISLLTRNCCLCQTLRNWLYLFIFSPSNHLRKFSFDRTLKFKENFNWSKKYLGENVFLWKKPVLHVSNSLE